MRTFACQACGQSVYFENVTCTQCGATLGFLPDELRLVALTEQSDGTWMPTISVKKLHIEKPPRPSFFARFFGRHSAIPATQQPVSDQRYRKCANYTEYNVCNWMVPAGLDETLCAACRPNQTIPNLNRPGNLEKWYRIERGKRPLAYGLVRLGLPIVTRDDDPEHGIAFDFLSNQDAPPDQPVLTGLANGVITLNIDEADPAKREQMRLDMDETYRTLVGHFRHEIGHYYWDVLIRDGGRLDSFRALFGDEQQDYGQALNAHYHNGPPADWQDRFVTTYASTHPWEDWAETWAHYMHITDTLETAAHFGMEVERQMPDGSVQRSNPDFDPYNVADFQLILEHWLPLAFAINSLNRSMGQQDLYPFVLPPPAIEKMAYVHRVIREAVGR